MLDLLKADWSTPRDVLRIYEDAGMLTLDNCRQVLSDLPDEKVEMKALLLQKTAEAHMDEWSI